MKDSNDSYFAPFKKGDVISNFGTATVLKTKSDKLKEGETITGYLPW